MPTRHSKAFRDFCYNLAEQDIAEMKTRRKTVIIRTEDDILYLLREFKIVHPVQHEHLVKNNKDPVKVLRDGIVWRRKELRKERRKQLKKQASPVW